MSGLGLSGGAALAAMGAGLAGAIYWWMQRNADSPTVDNNETENATDDEDEGQEDVETSLSPTKARRKDLENPEDDSGDEETALRSFYSTMMRDRDSSGVASDVDDDEDSENEMSTISRRRGDGATAPSDGRITLPPVPDRVSVLPARSATMGGGKMKDD